MKYEQFSLLARRSSSLSLGGVDAEARTGPITASARKKHRKKGDVNNRCKQQAEDWRAFLPTICAEGPVCEGFLACATPLATCDFTGFLVCLSASPAALADAIALR